MKRSAVVLWIRIRIRLICCPFRQERDFYFNKLREVEILLQNIEDAAASEGKPATAPASILDDIKKILYSTEEGFEVPAEAPGAAPAAPAAAPADPVPTEQDEY